MILVMQRILWFGTKGIIPEKNINWTFFLKLKTFKSVKAPGYRQQKTCTQTK